MDTCRTGTPGTVNSRNLGNYRFSYINPMSSTPTRKKISKSVSNARKVIRKLDSEGWRLVAFDVLDGDGMQPIQEWKVDTSYTPPYKSVKSTAILGGDVVNSVDYSVLFFEKFKG